MTIYEAAMRERERHKAELDRIGINAEGDGISLFIESGDWVNILVGNAGVSLTLKQTFWLSEALQRIFIDARPDLEAK